MTTPNTPSTVSNDRFHNREELVQFIEQQATAAVDRVNRPAVVDRRVPWATSGPVGQDSAGYSVLKAAAYALGYIGADSAKEEIHIHHRLKDLYAGYGFVPQCGGQSFLVPWATSHLPTLEPQGQRLRDEVRAKMLAQADRFDADEASWIARRLGVRNKSLGTQSDIAGGSFVGLPHLGELIDLQRNMEVFSAAGAQEVALPPNGRLQFPKLTGGSTAYWVGEATSITESQPATGSLELQAKKLGVFIKVNNELLRFASPSAEGLLRWDMARVAALKADQAMLEGTGGTQIRGLLTYPELPVHVASVVGANGNTFQPQDIALMESRLPDAVQAPTAWVMRKNLFAAIMNRRADAVTANDQKGGFVFHPGRSPGDPRPVELYGTRVVRSAQVSMNRVKGGGANLTYVLLGYFPDWVIARMGVMEFLASGLGDSALANDQTYLRGIQHIDAGPRQVGSFVLCDQLVAA